VLLDSLPTVDKDLGNYRTFDSQALCITEKKIWFQKKIKPEKIKDRNTKQLRSSGIEVIDHLPFLDNPEFREPAEIAGRTLVRTPLFQLHLRATKDIIKKWLEESELITHLTENELEYLETEYS
jgi:hypothetical protein